jgi:hypothetical protein
LDLIGLAANIVEAASNIDAGRKGLATKGKAEEGLISYETGISEAMLAFQEASDDKSAISVDPLAMLLAEYTFVTQEFQLCEKDDIHTINSLAKALQFFEDAFIALKVVENKSAYKEAEKTYPHYKDYRVSGFPKDAFHIACGSHKTRLQNILRTPGLNPIEKALLKQRLANLSTAQGGYVEKQKKAMDK